MRYKVGDKVRVRQLDDMVKEFGLDCKGNIYTEPYFFKNEMRRFCGKVLTIEYVLSDAYLVKDEKYLWIDDMFEPIEKEQENG